ncbi:hypothetical protein DFR39_1165 [Roseateles asaccharophilus]|uniref:Uncharacterized protein n=1 Tax=Roseateles asaccharophilus TaxID=582607 RepID=A0A4R6MQG7_9BURK|nr:hypothetical protein DFR39_1165 [Roseateles asaccharophilus]
MEGLAVSPPPSKVFIEQVKLSTWKAVLDPLVFVPSEAVLLENSRCCGSYRFTEVKRFDRKMHEYLAFCVWTVAPKLLKLQ